MAFLDETGLATLWGLTKGLHDKYHQHWWSRRTFPSVDDVVVGDIVTTETSASNFKASDLYGSVVGDPGNNSKKFYVQYSGELFVDSNGELQLSSPTVASTDYSDYQNDILITDLRGKYYKSSMGDGKIWYASPTASYESGSYCCWLSEVARVSLPVVPGEWENIASAEDGIYPHSGVTGGYQYEYLGVPFDNALIVPKITMGSYVGTGTAGEDNPNSLTFDFEPKLVFVGEVGSDVQARMIYGTRSGDIRNGANVNISMILTWNGNTVSWYNDDTNANHQLNYPGETYNYVAIG